MRVINTVLLSTTFDHLYQWILPAPQFTYYQSEQTCVNASGAADTIIYAINTINIVHYCATIFFTLDSYTFKMA